jgi:ribosome maturation factor RimP
VLRVFIDKAEKPRGVDVEDCTLVSNQLSRVLTVENVDYDRLESLFAGAGRVLKKAGGFRAFRGFGDQSQLRLPMNGRRNFNGVLLGVQDGKVRLRGYGRSGLEFGNIDKAGGWFPSSTRNDQAGLGGNE